MNNYIWGLLASWTPQFSAQIQSSSTSSLASSHGTDVWQMIWHAGFVVQFVLLLLVVFSVLSWGIILAKYKIIRDSRKENAEFEELFWHAGSLSAAYTQTKHLAISPLAAVFRLGYGEMGKVMRVQSTGECPEPQAMNQGVIENLQRALARAQAAEGTRLGRTVTFLATCANTAPFIGLFGTVWGIMDAFRSIGATGAANLATVAPGIAEALVTTATGLFAAIPAVVFYNYFNRRMLVLENDMASFAQDFLNLVERDLMRRASPPAEAPRPGEAARPAEAETRAALRR